MLTLFPHIFDSYLEESLIKRAIAKGIVSISVHTIRAYARGKHRKVDDRPFGGGPGMVLQVEPIWRAVQAQTRGVKKRRRILLFSTRGKRLTARYARRLASYDELLLICGRYEGVDERVARYIADEEISVGEYVLSGGELPALVLIEAVSRFIPGVLGTYESLEEIKGSYPVYTRPELFRPGRSRTSVWRVPKVLLSGDHKNIRAFREKHSKQKGFPQ